MLTILNFPRGIFGIATEQIESINTNYNNCLHEHGAILKPIDDLMRIIYSKDIVGTIYPEDKSREGRPLSILVRLRLDTWIIKKKKSLCITIF